MKHKCTQSDLIREDFPLNVGRIVDQRMAPRIRAAANQSQWGTFDLLSLSRDSYLQGFFDAAYAFERKIAEIEATFSIPSPS